MASGILFERRIKSALQLQGMNAETVSAKAGIGKSSLYQYLKNPESMSVGKFVALCKALHLDPAEVLSENVLYKGVKKK